MSETLLFLIPLLPLCCAVVNMLFKVVSGSRFEVIIFDCSTLFLLLCSPLKKNLFTVKYCESLSPHSQYDDPKLTEFTELLQINFANHESENMLPLLARLFPKLFKLDVKRNLMHRLKSMFDEIIQDHLDTHTEGEDPRVSA